MVRSRLVSWFRFFGAISIVHCSLLIAHCNAQNAPITTCATVSNVLPGAVSVPVTVTGFNNIGAISLTIDYDYAVMHFVNGVPHAQLFPFMASDADLGNGMHRITMGWFGSGKTLPDGSTIMTLNFTFIAGSTALTWYDDGSSCEYADGSYNVLNDIPTSTYYINGHVCGVLNAPGTIAGNSIVCLGQTGYYYSVNPVPGASGYLWTVPPGALVAGGGTSTWIIVDYPPGATSGNITVAAQNYCGTGPAASLFVMVSPLPVADAGNDTTIPYGTSTVLHAADGGSGTYSYHWYPEFLLVDPNVQDPQTVNLVSTNVFTVLVTDLATLCQNSDQVIVSVSGGPLNVNPVADPGALCRGSSSQLYANAGGGSGSYTYLWTCNPPGSPPWTSNLANPVVTPEETTEYSVTVDDGFSTASGTVTVEVTPVPGTPVIALNGTELSSDTCCGNQWYRDGLPIPGADGQYYTVTEDGLYFDIVSVNACVSDTSNAIQVVLTGREEAVAARGMVVFPNPLTGGQRAEGRGQRAEGSLNIRLDRIVEETFTLLVFNFSGELVYKEKEFRFQDGVRGAVDVSGLGSGTYLLVLQNGAMQPMRAVFIVL